MGGVIMILRPPPSSPFPLEEQTRWTEVLRHCNYRSSCQPRGFALKHPRPTPVAEAHWYIQSFLPKFWQRLAISLWGRILQTTEGETTLRDAKRHLPLQPWGAPFKGSATGCSH